MIIKIVSATYSLQITPEIMSKIKSAILRNEKGFAYTIIKECDGKVLDVDYPIGDNKIHITIKLKTPKDINPDERLWEKIAFAINNYIDS